MAVVFSTCPLCEATCGLQITVDDGAVTGIRGDAHDVLSHGFVCPKGASLKELHDDHLQCGVGGVGYRVDRGDPLAELLAKKIIEIAQTGVREPSDISTLAIKEIGIPT